MKATVPELQNLLRKAILYVEREVEELVSSHAYADGKIHDVDVARDVEDMNQWLVQAREAALE